MLKEHKSVGFNIYEIRDTPEMNVNMWYSQGEGIYEFIN